jgi:hypothetical protein
MGCWDIYCFLCGNTCHSSNFLYETFLENVNLYETTKKKVSIKNFKYHYELYKKNIKLFEKKINLFEKNTKWLNNCIFLCANNKIIYNCKEIECNIIFQDKNKNEYQNTTFYDSNYPYGVFIHTDCWKFIKKEFNVSLNYSHLPINIHDITKSKIFNFINYGMIENYWGQYFNFIDLFLNNDEELILSPIKNLIVSKNISKIFKQLNIRLDLKRISPPVSATFYKTNIYKIGINGNIWFVKSNKWIECKDTIHIKYLDTINKAFLIKKIVFIGDYNDEPIFIVNKIQHNKNIEYLIISSKEYLEKKYPKLIQ